MPPRVVEGRNVGVGFNSWYGSIPPVTRFLLTSYVVLALAARFDLLDVGYLFMSWGHIFKKFEVWRLVTNFLFIGPPSMFSLFMAIYAYQYGKSLESNEFQFDPAGFVYLLVFSGLVMLGSSLAGYILGFRLLVMPFYSVALIFVLMYVWSKLNPEQLVSLWGLFQFQAFYLPFVMLGITLVMGQDPLVEIMGILVGHLYYFLKYLYPQVSGIQLLETPNWLRSFAVDWGIQPAPVNPMATANDFRAFRGAGRRLGQS